MFIVYVGTNGEVLVGADQVDSCYCYSLERPRVFSYCTSALPVKWCWQLYCIRGGPQYRRRVEDAVTLIVPPSPTLLTPSPPHHSFLLLPSGLNMSTEPESIIRVRPRIRYLATGDPVWLLVQD